MSIKNIVILCIYACLATGCGLIEKKAANFKEQPADKTNSQFVKNILYAKYKNWQGVRYKLGGLSKNGIDCSGFVHVVYKSGLGINLPRTTNLQLKSGKKINKNELKAGDLVFFKIKNSLSSNHVGIYLEDKKFIHVSSIKGVTISRLDNTYWISRYWQSIRI